MVAWPAGRFLSIKGANHGQSRRARSREEKAKEKRHQTAERSVSTSAGVQAGGACDATAATELGHRAGFVAVAVVARLPCPEFAAAGEGSEARDFLSPSGTAAFPAALRKCQFFG